MPVGEVLGVAVALYRSEDVIADCLSSLKASQGAQLRVVLADNASPDDTCAVVRAWARAHLAPRDFAEAEAGEIARADAWLTLLHLPANGGFAHATNRALELLLADPAIGNFWLLNPDCRADPYAAAAYLRAAGEGPYALIGGRTLYIDPPGMIQSEGGRVSRWSGVCTSLGAGCPHPETPPSDPATLDYVSGANCLASRMFIERAGLMDEGYFLYYEEVDWAQRRGDLPLRLATGALAAHRGGSAIGSGTHHRRASPLSLYWNHRSRMRYLRRHNPAALPLAWLRALTKAAQVLLRGDARGARAVIAAITGRRLHSWTPA